MRVKSLLLSLLILIVVAAGWSGVWWFSAGQLREGFAAWQAARAAEGTRVNYESRKVSGYPFSLVLTLRQPELVREDGLAWSAAQLRGRAAVWSPLTIDLEAPGRHGISLPVSSGIVNLDLLAGAATGELKLTPLGEAESFHAEFEEIEVSEFGGPVTTAERLRLGVGRLSSAAERSSKGLPVDLWAEGLRLPESRGGYPLGRDVDRVQAEVDVQGGPFAGPWPDAAATWTAEGGVLQVSQFRLIWGPLDLSGEGALTLDERRRPLGAFTARIVGYLETVDSLAKAGLIELGDASILKLGGMALTKESDSQGRPVVTIPLTAQDGRLSVGPLPLFRLEPIF